MMNKSVLCTIIVALCLSHSPFAYSNKNSLKTIAKLKCDVIKNGSTKTVIYFDIYSFDGFNVEIRNFKGEVVELVLGDTKMFGKNGVGRLYGHSGGDGDGYIHSTNSSDTKYAFSMTNSDPPYDYFKGEIDRVTGKVWIQDTIRDPSVHATGTCEPGEYAPPATKF